MKLGLILSSLMISASALATPSMPAALVETARATQISSQPALDPQIDAALVHVDHGQNKVTVSFYNDICQSINPPPPGTVQCRAMPILVRQMSAKIRKIEIGTYGDKTIIASDDRRPVDGLLTEIKLIDNRDYILDIPVVPTTVEIHQEAIFGTIRDIKLEAETLR